MPAKIPWNKIKELAFNLSSQTWDDKEKELRRIIDETTDPTDRVINVGFAIAIDCSQDMPTVEAKISFSQKFSSKASGSVDDDPQMELGDKPKTAEELAAELRDDSELTEPA